jgi:hypothetical protein
LDGKREAPAEVEAIIGVGAGTRLQIFMLQASINSDSVHAHPYQCLACNNIGQSIPISLFPSRFIHA